MPAFTREARRINLAAEKDSLEQLKAQGASVIELTAAGQQGFRAKLAPIYSELRERIGPALYDQAQKVVESTK